MILLLAIIVLALVFDYTNGFHDTANAIATAVSTRAIPPRVAALMAAILNFVGALVSTSVATTVGQGIVDTHLVTLPLVLAALVGAVVWNFVTWYFGLPVSTTQTITAAIMGTGSARRLSSVRWGVAGDIATAWVLTLPAAALVSAGIYLAGVALL